MRLRCSHLGVTFTAASGLVRALDDLSFETREGEFLSFVGASGCGKTTLLRVAVGILPPREGKVGRIPRRATTISSSCWSPRSITSSPG